MRLRQQTFNTTLKLSRKKSSLKAQGDFSKIIQCYLEKTILFKNANRRPQMNRFSFNSLIFIVSLVFIVNCAFGQNPLIYEQFSADPTARVFEGKMYVYCSHDIPTNEALKRN